MDILKMTALEIGRAIKEKKITSVDAVNAVLDSIDTLDGTINAYVSVNRESALNKAKAIQSKVDSGELKSALAGVPIAIKDNICTKGIKTTCSSKILGDFSPVYNATVIEKLEAEGMIVLGKTNMDEFAMGSTCETSFYGETKNPYSTRCVPGGSSGGSAAAVSAREAIIALGSDTGGSIRQPASYCGVTGFKPTYGSVSRYGLIAYASSLDQIGPIAKDVADCAALTDIISGQDKLDSTSVDIKSSGYYGSLNKNIEGIKIAIPNQFFEKGINDEVRETVLRATEELKKLGATVSYIDIPSLSFVIPTYYIIASAEAASNLSRFDGVKYGFRADGTTSVSDLLTKTRTEGFGKEVKKRILLGNFVLSSGYYDAYYLKALKSKALIKKELNDVFSEYDVILGPTAPTTAPILGSSLSDPLAMYLSDAYTVIANLAGLPALSIPCGSDKTGMPIGFQLMGNSMCDSTVLNIGYAYQQATDYHKVSPEVRV